MQTGFGPFIGVALIHDGWNQAQIGLALSVGTASALALQLPGGAVVDAVHSKKLLLAVAMALTGDRHDGTPGAHHCRLANVRWLVLPTFSPKPRKMPRRLISVSWCFDCTSLRAVSRARVSCAGSDLQCTERNHPSRIN